MKNKCTFPEVLLLMQHSGKICCSQSKHKDANTFISDSYHLQNEEPVRCFIGGRCKDICVHKNTRLDSSDSSYLWKGSTFT